MFFASVSDTYFKRFICLQMYVASVVSECFKSRSGVAFPSLPSVASPWFLLLVFCYLASFSDCGGGVARADEGGALGADGQDAPGDCGADASPLYPLSLRGQVALRPLLVLYFTWDAEMVPLVDRDASPRFGWLGTGTRQMSGG